MGKKSHEYNIGYQPTFDYSLQRTEVSNELFINETTNWFLALRGCSDSEGVLFHELIRRETGSKTGLFNRVFCNKFSYTHPVSRHWSAWYDVKTEDCDVW